MGGRGGGSDADEERVVAGIGLGNTSGGFLFRLREWAEVEKYAVFSGRVLCVKGTKTNSG